MSDAPICQFLSWDTEFFGFRIGESRSGRLAPDGIESILDWAEDERIRCLYFLAEADSPETIQTLELNGFRLQDVRVTMTRRCSPGDAAQDPVSCIREAREADVPTLCAIARESHVDTRYYNDLSFSRERCGALYETWIQRSCLDGFADVVLIAESEGRPAGYISCSVGASGEGQIGLFAVDSIAKGKGIGTALIRAALAQFAKRGAGMVKTVTQGRNIPAQRTYQRCGFQTAAVQLWYHRWFDPPSA